MQNFLLTKNQIFENVEFFKEGFDKDYCNTVQQIIKSKPFGNNRFYIFQFVKRVDDVSGVKKMYHYPRLTKPDPLPGTTLLKCNPENPDEVTIVWTLPNQETFGLYKQGKAFGDAFVWECIEKFQNNYTEMCTPDPDDLSDEQIRDYYQSKKNDKIIRLAGS